MSSTRCGVVQNQSTIRKQIFFGILPNPSSDVNVVVLPCSIPSRLRDESCICAVRISTTCACFSHHPPLCCKVLLSNRVQDIKNDINICTLLDLLPQGPTGIIGAFTKSQSLMSIPASPILDSAILSLVKPPLASPFQQGYKGIN